MDHRLERAERGVKGGISAAVIAPDWTWDGTVGVADPATGRAITSETQFAIGSITKTFLAALVLRFVEDGLVELDRPISDYLPDDLGVDFNQATVAQVLGHQSGIGESTNRAFFAAVVADPDRPWTAREALVYTEPPQFEAGSQFGYTNTNYLLAGLMIEAVTGRSLSTELRDKILAPQDLDHIELQFDGPPSGPVAVGITDLDLDGTEEPIAGNGYVPTQALATAAGAAGGIAADATSIARWGRVLYGGDVLSPASLAAMTTEGERGSGYGLGTQILSLSDGTVGYGHNGGIPGFSSAFVHLLDQDVTIATLMSTNLVGGIGDPMEVAGLFYEPILAGSLDSC